MEKAWHLVFYGSVLVTHEHAPRALLTSSRPDDPTQEECPAQIFAGGRRATSVLRVLVASTVRSRRPHGRPVTWWMTPLHTSSIPCLNVGRSHFKTSIRWTGSTKGSIRLGISEKPLAPTRPTGPCLLCQHSIFNNFSPYNTELFFQDFWKSLKALTIL